MADALGALPAYIDNISQVLIQGLQVEADGKLIPISTAQGLYGFASGGGEVSISFDSVSHISGPEFDPFQAVSDRNEHVVQIPYGAKTITSRGKFMSASLNSGVNEATKFGYKFMGTLEAPV